MVDKSHSGQISPMRSPAQQFLSLRALGAPAVVVSLAIQGVFRGFKDTKTPLVCVGSVVCGYLNSNANMPNIFLCLTISSSHLKEALYFILSS
ncbi:MATE efflux family protein 3, chloroplastic [Dendrobium catenatum]|uniref:MATE efflux family protein 3, chloroplastic n=1 Tax=Dendrobium catenatum TaxID=906689 RepID=A0A2I0VW18_9ASPA|nr:MATE efflux family protein 3, chloroplastic [Dendrobium catenatum]